MPGSNRLTLHVLVAGKARGTKLGNPEQAKINQAKAAERALALRPHIERCIQGRPHIELVPSRLISTRAASRHRMAGNGFRCRLAVPAGALALPPLPPDRPSTPGVVFQGVGSRIPTAILGPQPNSVLAVTMSVI